MTDPIINMAPNESDTASDTAVPPTNDQASTITPPYERKGIFNIFKLLPEIREMIYVQAAHPSYALDTALADTVSFMRSESSIRSKQAFVVAASPTSTSTSTITFRNPNATPHTPTNANNSPFSTDLDDPTLPALSLNNLRLHPLARTTTPLRHEFLAAHFASNTFTLPIHICALRAPHPAPSSPIWPIPNHHNPLTYHYASPLDAAHAHFLATCPRLNGYAPPRLRRQHFKVTIHTDYRAPTGQPAFLSHPGPATTTRVEWEGFIDVVFERGELGIREAVLVGPRGVAGPGVRVWRDRTEMRAREAFERLKREVLRCRGGRALVGKEAGVEAGVEARGVFEGWDDRRRCPPNSPVLAGVAGAAAVASGGGGGGGDGDGDAVRV